MTSSVWQCPCLNITVRTFHPINPLPKTPFPAHLIRAAVVGSADIRYDFLAGSSPSGEWTTVRCLHCETDVYAQHRSETSVLLLFKGDDTRRTRWRSLPLSPTYGIHLEHTTQEPGFVGCELQRAVAAARLQKIRELLDEKEAEIVAFRRRVEETFEAKKHAVELEERDMLAACRRAGPQHAPPPVTNAFSFLADDEDDESEHDVDDAQQTPLTDRADVVTQPHPLTEPTTTLSIPSSLAARSRTTAQSYVFRPPASSSPHDDLPKTFQDFTLRQRSSDTPVSGSYVPHSFRSVLNQPL